MNKKIFIFSIFLVIILVLVTYTSAVGIQSKKSSNLKNCSSPLFTLRINNAINSNTPELKSSYIGKGENTLSFFSMRLFIDKSYVANNIAKGLSTDSTCNIVPTDCCRSSSCHTDPPCDLTLLICGPTDNGPFCGFTKNGPICDNNLFNNELHYRLRSR